MVARLTPDQKVACSIHVGFNLYELYLLFFCFLILIIILMHVVCKSLCFILFQSISNDFDIGFPKRVYFIVIFQTPCSRPQYMPTLENTKKH